MQTFRLLATWPLHHVMGQSRTVPPSKGSLLAPFQLQKAGSSITLSSLHYVTRNAVLTSCWHSTASPLFSVAPVVQVGECGCSVFQGEWNQFRSLAACDISTCKQLSLSLQSRSYPCPFLCHVVDLTAPFLPQQHTNRLRWPPPLHATRHTRHRAGWVWML